MATLWITEISRMALMAGGERAQAIQLPANTTQVVTFTAATLSAAFSSSTLGIRVWSSADCHILVGDNTAVATTSNAIPLAAKASEVFGVAPGQFLSVVAAA